MFIFERLYNLFCLSGPPSFFGIFSLLLKELIFMFIFERLYNLFLICSKGCVRHFQEPVANESNSND